MQMDLGSTAEGGIAPGRGGIARVHVEPGISFYFGPDCMEAGAKCLVSTPGYKKGG